MTKQPKYTHKENEAIYKKNGFSDCDEFANEIPFVNEISFLSICRCN